MISDTLSDAIAEINLYLKEMPEVYRDPALVHWIMQTKNSMDALRQYLDTPPYLHCKDESGE